MATGTVNGNKIHVTGFQQSNTKEQIYKVVASGVSTAELSQGATIESNLAKIKHEKHAEITLSNGGESCSGYTYSLKVSTVNIQLDTLVVSSYPSFVSEFVLYPDRLCYNLCPNIDNGFAGNEKFVVAGYDIYGNLITSESEISPGKNYDSNSEKIRLHSKNYENVTAITINASDTFFQLRYDINPSYIVSTSIEINTITGDFISYSLEQEDSFGTVTVNISQNKGRNESKVYTVTVKGLNKSGNVIVSNMVSVAQRNSEKNIQFYLTGENIEYSDTSAIFSINYTNGMIILSSIATSVCFIDNCGEIERADNTIVGYRRVVVVTDQNTTPCEREIYLTVTGKTTDGTTVVANGMVTQSPGVELKVYDDSNTPVESAVSSVKSKYYEQTRTIKYLSKNVSNIVGSFETGSGRITINPTQKSVTVSFSQNDDESDRTFKIKLSGKTQTGEDISAYYTFTQEKFGGNEFKLTSGGTEITGVVMYNTTSFQLVVSYPDGYEDFAVSLNESDSVQYKVYETSFSTNNRMLTCSVYENNTQRNFTYRLKVSAKTPEGNTVETNVFTATHQSQQGDGSIEFNSPTTVTVPPDATSYTNVSYSTIGIYYTYVDFVEASDGAIVTASDPLNNTLSLTFPAYPSEDRVIKLRLAGTDIQGNVHKTSNPEFFALTQLATGQASITIKPSGASSYSSEASMTVTGKSFSFDVKYTGINEQGRVIIYDTDVFSNVTTTSGMFIDENDRLEDIEYIIIFRGRALSDNSIVDGILKVTQKAADCGEWKLTIESNQGLYDENTGYYMLDEYATSAPIYIVEDDFIDYDELHIEINGEVKYDYDYSAFFLEDAEGEGHNVLQGSVSGSTVVNIPVGNYSNLYNPKMLTIQKDDENHLVGETYVYEIEIPVYVIEKENTVRLVGKTYCGEEVYSNELKFLQKGIPATEGEEDEDEED